MSIDATLDNLLANTPDHDQFVREVGLWLLQTTRSLNVRGSYGDVIDAGEALQRAAGDRDDEPGDE